jgi:SAM-dependent methyltransferase
VLTDHKAEPAVRKAQAEIGGREPGGANLGGAELGGTESGTAHWNRIYGSKADAELSWFEARPEMSLRLIREAGPSPEAVILDVGGGASLLIDHLLDLGFRHAVLLDLSETALERVRERLAQRPSAAPEANLPEPRLIAADIRHWQPDVAVDLWHDRATLHFLTEAADQQLYVATLRRALRVGGGLILGSFARGGPERCSGLPVERHDLASLQALLGVGFAAEDAFEVDHQTPWGATQRFQYARFRRRA